MTWGHGRMEQKRTGANHAICLPSASSSLSPSPSRRRQRGQSNWRSGIAAEQAAARHYQARGGTVLAERFRTKDGELDLVIDLHGVLVFVEVKHRSSKFADSPITERQWQRLANAALHYMVPIQNKTGVQPSCRFDVVLAGQDGRLRIIENARSFD